MISAGTSSSGGDVDVVPGGSSCEHPEIRMLLHRMAKGNCRQVENLITLLTQSGVVTTTDLQFRMVIGLSGTHELTARQHLENYGIYELRTKKIPRDDHGPTV